MEPILLEIGAGNDVIETLINLAQSHQDGIVVLSGYGPVTNVTIHQPASRSPPKPIEGVSNMTLLSGAYINTSDGIDGIVPPQTMNNGISLSFFSICLSDDRGQVFGGNVEGKLMAAGAVMITAAFLIKPTFHRLGNVNGNVEIMEKDEEAIHVGGLNINDEAHAP